VPENETGENSMVAAVQSNTIFGIRSRKSGQFAVMSGSLDVKPGILVFESRDHAEEFHRTVIGNKSINRQKRKAALKDWKVVGVPKLIPDERYCLAVPNQHGDGHELFLFDL
jgi:hypothetical protein